MLIIGLIFSNENLKAPKLQLVLLFVEDQDPNVVGKSEFPPQPAHTA